MQNVNNNPKKNENKDDIFIYHVCKFGCANVLWWFWFGGNYHSNRSVDNQKVCWKQLGMFHGGDHQHSNYMALNLMLR